MPKRVHVSLIHGTFARSAGWTEETSAFCKSIIAGLDVDATFGRPQWTGRNSAKDRIAAADELAASLSAAQLADPDCRQIVIGHSHGGSVLAYALARHPELAETVAGAFLSTPFIDARPRRNWFLTAMIVSLGFASILLATLLALAGIFFLSYRTFPTDHPLWFDLIAYSLRAALIVVVYFAVFWAAKASISSNPKRMARAISTCRLPTGKYLFVRTTGDEASVALSTAQFSSWVFSRLVQGAMSVFPKRLRRRPFRKKVPALIRRYVAPVVALCRVKVSVLLLMAITLIAGAFTVFAFVVLKWYLGQQGRPGSAPSVWKTFSNMPAYALSQGWMVRTIVLVEGFLALVAFAAFCYLFLIVLSFLISWISQRVFGGASLGAMMSLELAVEPIPIGSHTVVHATWAASYRGLTHSLAYQNPDTIAVVRAWIASIAKC